MHVLQMAVVSWISSELSVLIGHVCQGINTDMLTKFTKKLKLLSMQHFWGLQHIGDLFQGVKKRKSKILFQRNNKKKKKTSISHYLVSVKNRNPPVTFIQELC